MPQSRTWLHFPPPLIEPESPAAQKPGAGAARLLKPLLKSPSPSLPRSAAVGAVTAPAGSSVRQERGQVRKPRLPRRLQRERRGLHPGEARGVEPLEAGSVEEGPGDPERAVVGENVALGGDLDKEAVRVARDGPAPEFRRRDRVEHYPPLPPGPR